ncbi:hypothetical protein EV286_1116 [Rhizobium sp. BK251]|nr:hypothetical protein EV286_1116 [Rhizobium sp. BK251]
MIVRLIAAAALTLSLASVTFAQTETGSGTSSNSEAGSDNTPAAGGPSKGSSDCQDRDQSATNTNAAPTDACSDQK